MCGARMNQIFPATLMYAQSNDDRLPYYAGEWSIDFGKQPYWWVSQIARYVNPRLRRAFMRRTVLCSRGPLARTAGPKDRAPRGSAGRASATTRASGSTSARRRRATSRSYLARSATGRSCGRRSGAAR